MIENKIIRCSAGRAKVTAECEGNVASLPVDRGPAAVALFLAERLWTGRGYRMWQCGENRWQYRVEVGKPDKPGSPAVSPDPGAPAARRAGADTPADPVSNPSAVPPQAATPGSVIVPQAQEAP